MGWCINMSIISKDSYINHNSYDDVANLKAALLDIKEISDMMIEDKVYDDSDKNAFKSISMIVKSVLS